MEAHQHQKNRENYVEKQIEEGVVAQLRQENKEDQATKQSSSSSPPPTSPSSQPSASSSPSHEFSFTISLNSSSTTFPPKSKAPPSLAVDLSPADDIFFHGHLLPLHFLSHFPASPRSSTNSMDSFTLPIRELLEDENRSSSSSNSNRNNVTIDCNKSSKREGNNNNTRGTNVEAKSKSKSKSTFWLFGFTKGRKGCHKVRDKEDKEKHKKKLSFEVIHAIKKYLRMVQPLMLFRGKREKIRFRGQGYSYSGNVTPRNKKELKGWRGEYSAPASMITSPTNSGLLLSTTVLPPASDSTVQELQAAIQGAIAHCKNSIAKEENLKC
ncbi:BRI1 kinase inhibitor 1-like [Gastrolobium bilobum]|uniref:BRI1 kinase inhibitor 1-like n=1 Tax=Gastrolobium bilobum TaxID=150636 RepID=UPI002AB04876|nr:BRI1 kinase inhibitor 1-like [Gastrolobium bilobum]